MTRTIRGPELSTDSGAGGGEGCERPSAGDGEGYPQKWRGKRATELDNAIRSNNLKRSGKKKQRTYPKKVSQL